MNFVSIVTVNFNETAVTLQFLRSILENQSTQNVEVILVDNGCDQNDEEIFKKTYPELIFIRSEKNLGFAGANNLGIQRARGEYILFLNNDTEITAGLISVLVTEMDNNPAIGLLSPLLLYHEKPNIIQYAGFSKMNYLTARNKTIGKMDFDNGQYNQVSQETGFCHGAAMMCRRSDLDIVGLMEENYFLYYEEMDWCEKFRRAGKKTWFTGKAKVYHKESISVGKESALKTYFLTRNRILYIRKNTSLPNQIIFGLFYFTLVGPSRMIMYSLTGKKSFSKWVWRGMFWNIQHHKNSKHLGFPNLGL